MTELPWKLRYELGIPLIDEQHKRIFFLLNRLHEVVAGSQPRAEVEQVLEDLVRQTQEHFRTEERFMAEMKFPGIEEHRGQHGKLEDGLYGLMVRFRDGDASMAMLVTTYLGSWLRHHIREGDKAYADYLAVQERS